MERSGRHRVRGKEAVQVDFCADKKDLTIVVYLNHVQRNEVVWYIIAKKTAVNESRTRIAGYRKQKMDIRRSKDQNLIPANHADFAVAAP